MLVLLNYAYKIMRHKYEQGEPPFSLITFLSFLRGNKIVYGPSPPGLHRRKAADSSTVLYFANHLFISRTFSRQFRLNLVYVSEF